MRGRLKHVTMGLFFVSSTYLGWYATVKPTETSSKSPLIFGLIGAPYSMDPLEFNAFVHHVTTRPVHASLVSQYQAGAITGQIAESWSNSEDLSTWTFYIRPDIKFSNGDPITAETVRLALTRIAFLQHKRRSASGLTEHLRGVTTLTRATDRFEGISAEGSKLILHFNDPQPKLLEAISFGLYGITHPKDYDAKTGHWLSPKSAVASGAYQISTWTEDELLLSKRADVGEFLAKKNSPQAVRFVWSPHLTSKADIAMGPSLDAEQHSEDEYFGSGAMTTSIYYLHLVSWNDPGSPIKDRDLRAALRKNFYEHFAVKDQDLKRSFLPSRTINDYADDNRIISDSDPKLPQLLKNLSLKIAAPRANSVFASKLYESLESSLIHLGIQVETVPRPNPKTIMAMLDPKPQDRGLDILALYTNILVEDPIADVKFMITSKEGIRLPDPTGRLKAEAAKDRPDFTKINQILYDDAIVWPVAHFSSGLFAKRGLFDFSQINLSLPPTDISFIGVLK